MLEKDPRAAGTFGKLPTPEGFPQPCYGFIEMSTLSSASLLLEQAVEEFVILLRINRIKSVYPQSA